MLVFLVCSKEAALHTEPKKENLEPGLEQDQKPRLDSVSSGESFASSGFQEDKSVSDTEEDEGRHSFFPGLLLGYFLQYTGYLTHFFSYLSPQ